MIRMRCAARILLVAVLSGSGMAVAGGATLFLIGGADRFLHDAGKILGAIFAVIMGLFAFAKAYNTLFIEPVLAKMDAKQDGMIAGGLVKLKESFHDLITQHVNAHDPHPSASDRMHEPLVEADRKILAALAELRALREKDAKRLGQLIHAHNVTMGAQRKTIDAIACIGHRNPAQSPYPRRATDPEHTDFTSKRGHPREDDETFVEEEER